MSLTEVGAGQVELVVRGPGALATSVRLFDWSRADEYESVFAVEAVADGVRARLENVTVTVWDDLSEFFDSLARDFRGWEGERVWINNHLVVTATFGSGGHVSVQGTPPVDRFGLTFHAGDGEHQTWLDSPDHVPPPTG